MTNRDDVLRQYQHQLAWAQTRLIEVRDAWARRQAALTDTEIVLSTDIMAIQLRMALESIAFATLVTNKKAYARARPKGASDWHARRILQAIAEVNPNFYPWPFTISLLPTGTHIEAALGPYLTEKSFIAAYDELGGMLHAPSPLNRGNDYRERGSKIARWGDLAERLVHSHIVELPGQGFVVANVDRNTGASRVQLAEPLNGASYLFKRPVSY